MCEDATDWPPLPPPPPQPPGFEFVIIFAAESKIFALDPFVGGEGEFIKPPRRLASLL